MFPDKRCPGNRPASTPGQIIFQLEQGIVISPISIDDNADSRRIMRLKHMEPFAKQCRHSSHIHWHTDDE
jgi:hypothetical protein